MQYFCNIFFSIPKVLQRTQVFWKLLISFWLNWQHMNCQQQKAVFIWLRTPVWLLTLVQERESSTTSANVPSLFVCWSSPPWFSSKETMIFWRYYWYLFSGLCDSVFFFFFLTCWIFFYSQLLEKEIFVPAFFELVAIVVCEPSAVGFNVADVVVMKNLPEVCVPALKALLASPYRTLIESSMLGKFSQQRYFKSTVCFA